MGLIGRRHEDVETGGTVPALGERRYLFPAEIAALFWQLQQPHNEEQRKLTLQQLDAAQKSANALFMLTGDGEIKGQLPLILEQLAEGKQRDEAMRLRQGRILRRVGALESQRKEDHTENRLARELDRANQTRAIAGLRRELRSIRRSQLWVVRYSRGFYDWCTSKDETGRYSRARVSAFLVFLATAEETLRHYLPLAWHKVAVFFHSARL